MAQKWFLVKATFVCCCVFCSKERNRAKSGEYAQIGLAQNQVRPQIGLGISPNIGNLLRYLDYAKIGFPKYGHKETSSITHLKQDIFIRVTLQAQSWKPSRRIFFGLDNVLHTYISFVQHLIFCSQQY